MFVYVQDFPFDVANAWLWQWSTNVIIAYEEEGFRVYRVTYGDCQEDVVVRQPERGPLTEISTGTGCTPWSDDEGLATHIFTRTGKTAYFSPKEFLAPGIFISIDGFAIVVVGCHEDHQWSTCIPKGREAQG
jgi:hypothetical protein